MQGSFEMNLTTRIANRLKKINRALLITKENKGITEDFLLDEANTFALNKEKQTIISFKNELKDIMKDAFELEMNKPLFQKNIEKLIQEIEEVENG